MIIDNQKNIRVHFAGLENTDFAMVLHECGKIKYSLFTIFPFIADKVGIKPLKMPNCDDNSSAYLENASRHVIMDSGLFTLMFGAHAGKRDDKFIDRWYNLTKEFLLSSSFRSTIVEIDCQKVLGEKRAWHYRELMKKEIANRQINVFHIEDGNYGLDKMIEFSDYIALSIPELRILGKKDNALRIACYIKNKKPDIDIHLLGCTELSLLKSMNFCTSSDSTAWQQVNRYGVIKYNNGHKTFSYRNKDICNIKLNNIYKEQVISILERLGRDVTDKRIDYYTKYALASSLLKNQYSIYAGIQE